MAAFGKFNQFVQDLANKKHDLSADVIKWMLTNVAPVAANAIKADITEIAGGNGYTAGGHTAATTSSSQAGGLEKLIIADVTITATGPVGPFRYAVAFNDTQATPAKPLIGYLDYGSSISLANTDTFLIDVDQAGGFITLQ